MNIESIKSFAATLSDIDHTKNYVAFRGGNFCLVAEKSAKGDINTQMVAQLGQEALRELEKSSRVFFEKAHALQDLAQGLESYLRRLYQHKNTFERLLHFVGISSSSERTIQKTAALLKKNALLQKKVEESWRAERATVDQQITSYDKFCSTQLLSNKNQEIAFKLFTHSVLDSSKVQLPKKYRKGLKGTYARKFMLEHLRKYVAAIGPKHPFSATVKKVLREFEANTRISHALYLSRPRISSWTKRRNLFHPFMLDWTMQQVLHSIAALKNPGEQFAIQGGYLTRSRGHSVQYVFMLENSGAYKFTIVNTGAGADRIPPSSSSKSPRMRTEDQAWSHIPKSALNADFIHLLFSPRLYNGAHNMAKVKKAIIKHFRNYPTVRSSRGRNHKLQGYGSCTVKSLASWLHGRMKEPVWRSFKVFYTQNELKKLPIFLKTISSAALKQQVISESERILHKRRLKAEHHTAIK